jgi:hypothetical protein
MSGFIRFGEYRFPRSIAEAHPDPPRVFVHEDLNKWYMLDDDEANNIFIGVYSVFGRHFDSKGVEKTGWHPLVISGKVPKEYVGHNLVWDKFRQNCNLVNSAGMVVKMGEDNILTNMTRWIRYYDLVDYVSYSTGENEGTINMQDFYYHSSSTETIEDPINTHQIIGDDSAFV